jgi:hypothetical protein
MHRTRHPRIHLRRLPRAVRCRSRLYKAPSRSFLHGSHHTVGRASTGSGSAHWFAAATLPRLFEQFSCFNGREGLGGYHVLDAAAGGCQRNNRGGLCIRHFREHYEIVLAEGEIKIEQLAAGLLAQPGDGRLPVFRPCQTTLVYFRVKRPYLMKIAIPLLRLDPF